MKKTYSINCGDLTESFPESMFWLTDLAVITLGDSGSLIVRILAGFSKPDFTVNTLSASSAAYQRVFTFITGLLKPGKSSLYRF
jgi:hypothetical protein